MGAIIILAPAMMAAWPVVSASVAGAATAMGFAQLNDQPENLHKLDSVELDVEGGETVVEQLAASEKLIFQKDDMVLTFARDARGKCRVTMHGQAAQEELRSVGQEFAGEVVQQYAYHVLMGQLDQQGFNVVDQEVTEDQTIHVRVRRFE